MQGFLIHIAGRVQGVGFRPFVCDLATKLGLKGNVRNTTEGVFIELATENRQEVTGLVQQIIEHAPPRARMECVRYYPQEVLDYPSFSITTSENTNPCTIKVSPDFALCQDCRVELLDPKNRRYKYAFITCSVCGPRYSIMDHLPYDRPQTTMSDFDMCTTCDKEYSEISNRRFYSQTNSCSCCGVQLAWHGHFPTSLSELPGKELMAAKHSLSEGKIVAVKGIGGYLLLCDATSRSTIQRLRDRKQRPHKPFAVLFDSPSHAGRYVEMPEEAEQWLSNEVSPIMLLESLENSPRMPWDLIAPGLSTVGVMVPYAPLLQLIATEFGRPLIATSGNISGGSIAFADDSIEDLLQIADGVLSHNREILHPQDDSVMQMASGTEIILRRSRGLAPSYFGPIPTDNHEGILALGGHLKGAFGLSQGGSWHISQYLGRLDGHEAQEAYKSSLQHVMTLFQCDPEVILFDKHPTYFTSEWGSDWARSLKKPVVRIQHHEAHFAAVLQENDLIDEPSSVLGVIWDGTGMGDDGQIWGGEFFEYSRLEMKRLMHFNYVPVLANDKMAESPRLSLLAFSAGDDDLEDFLKEKFTATEWQVYRSMAKKPMILTSSAGRLFDAVACLLGLIDDATYEGQAAMLLEQCARSYKGRFEAYHLAISEDQVVMKSLLRQLLKDKEGGVPVSQLAHKFHGTLVELVRVVARDRGYRSVAFSGGVFQNALLVSLLKERLSSQFALYFHRELSPNDENISFGQLAHYHMGLQRQLQRTSKRENYVSSDTW
ncbi:MAG: carbamoyltransferase HypF [Bacteroidota bacterium]